MNANNPLKPLIPSGFLSLSVEKRRNQLPLLAHDEQTTREADNYSNEDCNRITHSRLQYAEHRKE